MADDPDQPDFHDQLKRLDQLKQTYKDKGYRDYHEILRARVTTAAELKDQTGYREVVEELRDYYKKKYELLKDWDGMQPYFLQSSAVLVLYFLENKQRDQAVTILQETKALANPHEQWFFQFPKTLNDEAFQKSVLDKQSNDSVDQKNDAKKEDSAKRDGNQGSVR